MNALELADKLMSSLTMEYDCDKYMEQAATMLRQQQAEIEELKKFKAEIDAENKKLFEAAQKANDVWNKATGRTP
jgi:hypothetical protein